MEYEVNKSKRVDVNNLKQGDLFLDPDNDYVYIIGIIIKTAKKVAIELELGEVIPIEHFKYLVYRVEPTQKLEFKIKKT